MHDYLLLVASCKLQVATNLVSGVVGIEALSAFDSMLTELKQGTLHKSTNGVTSTPDIYLNKIPTALLGSTSVTSAPSGFQQRHRTRQRAQGSLPEHPPQSGAIS